MISIPKTRTTAPVAMLDNVTSTCLSRAGHKSKQFLLKPPSFLVEFVHNQYFFNR